MASSEILGFMQLDSSLPKAFGIPEVWDPLQESQSNRQSSQGAGVMHTTETTKQVPWSE